VDWVHYTTRYLFNGGHCSCGDAWKIVIEAFLKIPVFLEKCNVIGIFI